MTPDPKHCWSENSLRLSGHPGFRGNAHTANDKECNHPEVALSISPRHCHTVAADLTGREKPSRLLRLHRCKGGRGLQPYNVTGGHCRSWFRAGQYLPQDSYQEHGRRNLSLLKTLIGSIAVRGKGCAVPVALRGK